ncbi:MAG: hypothetical protein HOP18_02925 [Deltaproteobacteria bacterium]|nr:hypothetical protein [Deltaproteobacteria bacterium]
MQKTYKTWTWSRQGWVCSTPAPTRNTGIAESGVPYRAVTCPTPTPLVGDDAPEETEEFHRLMQVSREALDLSLADVALMTGLSVRTLHRAEEDAEYRPQAATRQRLSWFYGEAAWLPVGYHVVNPEHDEAERHAAAVEKAASFLARCCRAPYRRRATGATRALTWLILGGRIGPFLLLSSLVPPRRRSLPRAEEPQLSSDEERELGFPERAHGEVVQHEGGTVQSFVRVASAYARALCAGHRDACALLRHASDALSAVTDDDLAYVLGLSRAEIRHELTRHRQHEWTTGRPKVAGPLWQVLEVAEESPEWETAATPLVPDDPPDDLPEPTRLDDAVTWVLAHEAEVAELLDVSLPEVDARIQRSLHQTQVEILASLRAAAKWAATLPGDPTRLFAERVQRLCGGGTDGTRTVRGLGLDPEVVATVVDLPGLLQEAVAARAREQALWRSVSDWIEQPLRGPEHRDTTPAHQLTQALLSLLPDPPIAEAVCLAPTQAQAVIETLGPQFLPELSTDADRGRRFVLGALRDWLQRHRGRVLPLRAMAEQRRLALHTGVSAALAGRGEESTAGKMARALFLSVSRPLPTPGRVLAASEVQTRVRTGLPYFFPMKMSTADRYAQAQRILHAAWQSRPAR